jgi:hypothetical protein
MVDANARKAMRLKGTLMAAVCVVFTNPNYPAQSLRAMG